MNVLRRCYIMQLVSQRNFLKNWSFVMLHRATFLASCLAISVKAWIYFQTETTVAITSHNTRIIRKSQPQDIISTDNCNCRNKHACPLQNTCMSERWTQSTWNDFKQI